MPHPSVQNWIEDLHPFAAWHASRTQQSDTTIAVPPLPPPPQREIAEAEPPQEEETPPTIRNALHQVMKPKLMQQATQHFNLEQEHMQAVVAGLPIAMQQVCLDDMATQMGIMTAMVLNSYTEKAKGNADAIAVGATTPASFASTTIGSTSAQAEANASASSTDGALTTLLSPSNDQAMGATIGGKRNQPEPDASQDLEELENKLAENDASDSEDKSDTNAGQEPTSGKNKKTKTK